MDLSISKDMRDWWWVNWGLPGYERESLIYIYLDVCIYMCVCVVCLYIYIRYTIYGYTYIYIHIYTVYINSQYLSVSNPQVNPCCLQLLNKPEPQSLHHSMVPTDLDGLENRFRYRGTTEQLRCLPRLQHRWWREYLPRTGGAALQTHGFPKRKHLWKHHRSNRGTSPPTTIDAGWSPCLMGVCWMRLAGWFEETKKGYRSD